MSSRREIKLVSPELAVVIPVYKQPQYLKDAVTSVLKQSIIEKLRIVIVNDGCPYASTDAIARTFFDAHPGLVFYLAKPNGGLSSARNHGIRFALAAWPTLKAVFPLDADNKLSPRTLEKLFHRLEAAPADVGWVYQDLVTFGTEEKTWHTGVPFSLYRLLHENCCDAGSLVRRRVFEAGVWYDEEMKTGYEDWEFFVNAGLHGFKALHTADTQFLYRVRGHSMLSETKAAHSSVTGYIWRKHGGRLAQTQLSRIEHAEMPRFALVDLNSRSVTCVTNPLDSSAAREESLDQFVARIARWAAERPPKKTYVPPVTVLVDGRAVEILRRLRLLPGLLFSMQRALRRVELYELSFAPDPLAHKIELVDGSKKASPVLYALATTTLLARAKAGGPHFATLLRHIAPAKTERATMRIGGAWFAPGQNAFLQQLNRSSAGYHGKNRRSKSRQPPALARHAVRLVKRLSNKLQKIEQLEDRVNNGALVVSHANFASSKHLCDTTTFPFFAGQDGAERNLLIVMPWMTLGGVELCMLHLARQLRTLAPNLRVHLLLTNRNLWEAGSEWLEVFSTVSFVPMSESDRDEVIMDCLQYADIIINAHSLPAYRLWPAIRRKTGAFYFSSLHVMEIGKDGLPWGYPMIAVREYENLIDCFVVPSNDLRRSCESFGAPADKIIVARNAAAVSPATREEAIALAEAKAARRYSPEQPLRILFSGRFDVQKGIDRLEETAERLARAGLPVEFEVRGKAVISTGQKPPRIAGGRLVPPSVDVQVLARGYEEADVFFLPSRWEGVPLTILEAMSFGCIVIATDVGGISEIIEDGTSGFLLDNEQPDFTVAAMACDIIARIVTNPEDYAAMRVRAVEQALRYTWRRGAEAILARIKGRL